MMNDCAEVEVRDLGIEIPVWIEDDIDISTVVSINQGGCGSGAYMPAVEYRTALKTMERHGDAVMDYIGDGVFEYPEIPTDKSWAGLACWFVSLATEMWAHIVYEEIICVFDEIAQWAEDEGVEGDGMVVFEAWAEAMDNGEV